MGLRFELTFHPQPVASPDRSNASSRVSSQLIRRSIPAVRTWPHFPVYLYAAAKSGSGKRARMPSSSIRSAYTP